MNNIAPIEIRSLVAGEVPLTEEERYAKHLAYRMRAFCNPIRLRILRILAGLRDRVVNVNGIVALIGEIDQSGISRHIQVLERVGFLRCIESKIALGIMQHFYIIEREIILQTLNEIRGYVGI